MTFTNSGDIIYAVGLEQEMANPDEDTFGSSFKTFDASDYSLIGIQCTLDIAVEWSELTNPTETPLKNF